MSRAFLDVARSATGRRWIGPGAEVERQAERLTQNAELDLPVARVLAARGILPEAAQDFLAPTLRALLPDPRSLRDMEHACERIARAVAHGEKIAIFADYDVDGGSSAALLIHWLRDLGQTATLYVPDRLSEGYGPNAPAMRNLAQNHDIIICVDCGTMAHEAIEAANGADVIILDHHLGGETLPDAFAVVNPNRQDENGDLAHLCAAGVVFLALVEITRQRREAGHKGPDLMSLLDLVALATVADVAPLIGVNRAFVRQGLTVMARRTRPGLTALADISRASGPPSAYHLGFVLGPRINAGGRIGTSDLGARLLAAANPQDAAKLAEELDALNTERRATEEAIRIAAIAQAEARGTDAALVWAAGEEWHPGVVGITASRLKENYNRPSIVLGIKDGIAQGSGRSVTGIDLGAVIQRVAAEGLLLKGGGHKMAAGLTADINKLPEAMARITELLERQGAHEIGAADLPITGLLTPSAAQPHLIEQIEAAGPFGAGAPAPCFAFADMAIAFVKEIGQGHLKIAFHDRMGHRCEAIAFGAYNEPLGIALRDHKGRGFHLAGQLEINHWQGRKTVQLRLQDAAPATAE